MALPKHVLEFLGHYPSNLHRKLIDEKFGYESFGVDENGKRCSARFFFILLFFFFVVLSKIVIL